MPFSADIKLGEGFSGLPFGVTQEKAVTFFGKPDSEVLLDELEFNKASVWRYNKYGFSLFFEESNQQLFSYVEVYNIDCKLWGIAIFELNEKQLIELFKSKNIKKHETETEDWGERRLSFETMNVDFYFERNKLISVNYGIINK
jgi:hypothetical protein